MTGNPGLVLMAGVAGTPITVRWIIYTNTVSPITYNTELVLMTGVAGTPMTAKYKIHYI